MALIPQTKTPTHPRRIGISHRRYRPGKWFAALLIAAQFGAGAAYGYTELEFLPEVVPLSPPAGAHADKVRLIRLGDGVLVAAWQESAGPADGAWTVEGTPYAPRDVFLRLSTDDGATWSEPVNLSNTANQTDPAALYDRIGDGSGLANYYGDSDKPNLFAVGNRIAVSWNDTFCGPGVHGPALYDGPLGQIEVPFRCVYIARLDVTAGSLTVVQIDRLTDATRDANEEVVRGTAAGFAAIWQEDPLGLQPGEAEGEGDGSSGARVTEGTDIWYAAIPMASFGQPLAAWSTPLPITDNYDYTNDVVQGGGASRPQFALVGNPAYAQLVYEERKNLGSTDYGKYVIYHQFPFAAPTASQPGTIVSNPSENARRARVVSQGTPGSASGARLILLWRQGIGQQGAPSDVMARIGRVPAGTSVSATPDAGFRVADLWPVVDPLDPTASEPALNLTSANLDDPTSALPDQDAKAHRAVLDGDFIFAGYTQNESVSDPAATLQYHLRRSTDGGTSWTAPQDVSSGVSAGVDVIEPRLVRTPATVNSGDPEDVRNPNTYLLAWGTGSMSAAAGDAPPGDLFVTRTTDRGATYEPVQRLRKPDDATTFVDEGIQPAVTPDGRRAFAVWIRREGEDSAALFNSAVAIERTADVTVTGSTNTPAADLGAPVTAVFTVTNTGPDTATELTLTLTPDAALAVQSVVPATGTCSGTAPVLCELGDLPSGASIETTITLTSEVGGTFAVVAQTAARELEPNPADNAATVEFDYVPKADLAIGLAASVTAIKEGKTFRLDLTLNNLGPQPATGVRAQLTLPANLQALTAPGCTIQSNSVVCMPGNLATGQSWSAAVDVRAVRKGTASASASVAGEEVDPAAGNDTDSVDISIKNDSGGGCSLQPGGAIDPTLPLLLLGSLTYLWRRRVRGQSAG